MKGCVFADSDKLKWLFLIIKEGRTFFSDTLQTQAVKLRMRLDLLGKEGRTLVATESNRWSKFKVKSAEGEGKAVPAGFGSHNS